MMIKKTGSIIILTIVLLACGGGSIADPNDPEQLKSKISELANEVQILIGEAKCTDNNQCSAIAMGNKACGGPSFYLPYSTLNTDTNALEQLAKEHRDLSSQYNKVTGMMSDCAFVTAPPVACVNERCEAQ